MTPSSDLSLRDIHDANLARCKRWHAGFPDDEAWSTADWTNAVGGEGGEMLEAAMKLSVAIGRMQNTAKKVRRYETGTNTDYDRPEVDLREELAREIADIILYADLLATKLGLDLSWWIALKFNEVSERQGFPERLGAAAEPAWVTKVRGRAQLGDLPAGWVTDDGTLDTAHPSEPEPVTPV